MKRNEAISLLADMNSDKYTAKEAVALTMAIKTLEREETIIAAILGIIEEETLDPGSGEDEGCEIMSYSSGWMACGYAIEDRIRAEILKMEDGEENG